MIHERIEVHLECDTQEEADACKLKLTEYGFEVEDKPQLFQILATKHLILTKEEL